MARFYVTVVAFLLISATIINAKSQKVKSYPKGRLLTPEEGCGYSKVQNTRIVGGAPAKNGAWPWLALLFCEDDEETWPNCGGSLITSRHILSAAHCINDDLKFARLGEYDTRTEEDGVHVDVRIAQTKIHGHYDKKIFFNDIAMIYLAEDVEFNQRIKPICLPFSRGLLKRRFVDSNPFLAGWGHTSEDSEDMSPILMQIQIPVVENGLCKESYRRVDQVDKESQFDDRVVCAGLMEGGKDSCQGDSGGPLMLPIESNGTFPFYQIGIVSWADGCAKPRLPGINANVQFHSNWIKKNLLLSFDEDEEE